MRKILIIALAVVAAVTGSVATERKDVGMTDKEILECYTTSHSHERTQNYDDAISALAPLRRNNARDYTLNLRLGWLYYLSGNYANSRQYYQRAAVVSRSSVETRLGYMLPLLAQERYEEVESVARQVINIDYANYYANLRLAYALRLQKKHDQAEKVLDQMLLLYPSDVSFLTELGLVKEAQNEPQAARQIFYDVLTLYPDNATARYRLEHL